MNIIIVFILFVLVGTLFILGDTLTELEVLRKRLSSFDEDN